MSESEADTQAAPEAAASPRPTVVGIGASAGGLEALRRLFAAVPADSGLAWVVVVHLRPDSESHLADLLQPHASIPVTQVAENTLLEPNRAYVIPPGRNLLAVDSHLRLTPLEPQARQRAPIDHFFETLAQSFDGHSVAVILTGTGSDGTLGAARIRERGGIVIVQDPEEAEFDSMPRSAVASGAPDLVLPLDEIPGRLLSYNETRDRMGAAQPGEEAAERNQIRTAIALIRADTGHDFSRYRPSTVRRRIDRRMRLQGIQNLRDYVGLLQGEKHETIALAEDLLINVTSFFRDAEVFEHLEKEIVPKLFTRRGPEDPVRIWSVGCATGEEAYSLGMLLMEEAERRESPAPIQIFASDLHARSLQRAREGLYPETISSDISPARLARFFQREGGGYRVQKELRDRVVFASHDLLRDPPFSRLDLIACRNVLVYLERGVRNEVTELFHYALETGGLLLVGTPEVIDRPDLFEAENEGHRLYRRRGTAPSAQRPRNLPLSASARIPISRLVQPPFQLDKALSYGALHQRMIEGAAPPSVLVNRANAVVHISEQAGRFLQVSGVPSTNLFKLVHKDLQVELRAALHAAREAEAAVRSRPIPMRINGKQGHVVLHVHPSMDEETEGLFLVIFEQVAGEDGTAVSVSAADEGTPEMATELNEARYRLESLLKEYEASQEEMRASNEELQSANEELRSTMEELETSQEELRSINEELVTANQENRHKVEELSQLSSDLQNLFSSTDLATLFLDRSLRILRFTPRVAELFSIRPADRGRPLADLTHRLGYADLLGDAQRVLKTLAPIEKEVLSDSGVWHLVRILAYRTVEDRIDGVVITLVDISRVKRAEEETSRFFSLSLDILAIASLRNGHWLRVNSGMTRVLGWSEEELLATPYFDIIHPEDQDRAKAALADLRAGVPLFHYELRLRCKDGSYRWIEWETYTQPEEGRAYGAGRDVTERKVAAARLQESEAQQRYLLHLSDALRPVVDPLEIQFQAARLLCDHLDASRVGYAEVAGDQQRVVMTCNGDDGVTRVEGEHPHRYFGAATLRQLRAGGTVVIPDIARAPSLDGEEKEAHAERGFASTVAVPLLKDERLVAIFIVHQDRPREWTPAEVTLIQETGERTWAAVERAGAEGALRKLNETLEQRVAERTAELTREIAARREVLRQLVVTEEEERRRISLELHDQMGQQLTGLLLGLHSARAEADSTRLAARLRELEEMAGEIARDAQSMAVELRPPALDALGLVAAIQSHLEDWGQRHGLTCDLHVGGLDDVRLSRETETTLYRVLQEGLTNVLKHAGASHVGVLLERRGDIVHAILEDDGRGFDVDGVQSVSGKPKRLGLRGMQERVALLGGELQIESSSGEGTTVYARVPLEEAGAGE